MANGTAPLPGQGTASSGDVVTQLKGITSQLSTANSNMLTLITALQAINFPQSLKGYTVAGLPSSPSIGSLAYITDGTAGLAWGAPATGGHSTTYLCWWNGAAWTVVGK